MLTGFAAFAGAAWVRSTGAQAPAKLLRIGVVSTQPKTAPVWNAFAQRLRELGYLEARNLAFEFLETTGQAERYVEGMKDLVSRNVDLIIASGAEIALKAALAATETLPIVMVAIDYDPVARGYVASLARPGGNVTGVFLQQIELSVKRLELLRDAFPQVREATVLWDDISADQWQASQNAAPALGLQLAGVQLRNPPYDYEAALSRIPEGDAGTLIVLTSPIFFRDRERIADLALRRRLISMFVFREWVEAGGLICYGPSINTLFQRAADYVDRIARGAKPSDLPIEQPTKFEMIVNLKTARAIGVRILPSVLLRADEVIE